MLSESSIRLVAVTFNIIKTTLIYCIDHVYLILGFTIVAFILLWLYNLSDSGSNSKKRKHTDEATTNSYNYRGGDDDNEDNSKKKDKNVQKERKIKLEI
jgi:hypothetical protein